MHDQSWALQATTIVRSPQVRQRQHSEVRTAEVCYQFVTDNVIRGHVATLIEVPH